MRQLNETALHVVPKIDQMMREECQWQLQLNNQRCLQCHPEEPQQVPEPEPRERSPKRSTRAKEKDAAKVPRTETQPSSGDAERRLAEAVEAAVPEGDAFFIDAYMEKVVGELRGGWRRVDGGFKLDSWVMCCTQHTENAKSIHATSTWMGSRS